MKSIIKCKIFLGLLFLFIFVSCEKPNEHEIQQIGGVVLTFDDYYISNWLEVDSVFQYSDWKATFCITKYHTLSEEDKNGIKYLQNEGHEIAFHGTNHINVKTYLNTHSIQEYLEYEIIPDLIMMKTDGLDVKTFAYPYGARNEKSDSALAQYFEIIRGTAYNTFAEMKQKRQFLDKSVENYMVFGEGIDKNYQHFSEELVDSILAYIRDNNKIVIFYSHKVKESPTENYVTDYQTLKKIIDFVNNNNLKFYTLNEINK